MWRMGRIEVQHFAITLLGRPSTIGTQNSCYCDTNYNPVCGMDGNTYRNFCSAGCANVQATPGECNSIPQSTLTCASLTGCVECTQLGGCTWSNDRCATSCTGDVNCVNLPTSCQSVQALVLTSWGKFLFMRLFSFLCWLVTVKSQSLAFESQNVRPRLSTQPDLIGTAGYGEKGGNKTYGQQSYIS